ncbi:MAG: hypothetical protein KDB23_13620 [Planctomycetales bacterium]|nr:hypothetical protein [Planctomycetales bacterium]
MRDLVKSWVVRVALAAIGGLGQMPTSALACPFCTSVSQTFSEEINSMQVAVLATLIEGPPPATETDNDPNAPLPKAKFKISYVIKGAEWVAEDSTIEVLFFSEPNKDRAYLIMGTDAPQVTWSTPLPLSDRARGYVLQLSGLPSDAKRLEFFQEYLEDEDEMLARDAYDEFAKAPYSDVKLLKDKMHHDRLIAWAKDSKIPASRRRLYYTMLGVCGKPADATLLEELMVSEDRKMKAGLDAMIACYLILKGEPGLDEIDTIFLKNAKAEYADTYAAIMAIRFHGTETSVLPKKRLVQSLRHLLGRPELADLVIPDLAKWEDWEVMPQLIRLFKEADEKSSWVRVPVVNYLRSCPLPEAKEAIKELEKIDPESVKRAQTFFPFDSEGNGGGTQPKQDDSTKTSAFTSPARPLAVFIPGPAATTADGAATLLASTAAPALDEVDSSDDANDAAAATTEPATVAADGDAGSAQDLGTTTDADAADSAPGKSDGEVASLSRAPNREAVRRELLAVPNRATLLGVPIVAGVVLLYTLGWILGVPIGRKQA